MDLQRVAFLILLVLPVVLNKAILFDEPKKCGYQSCHATDPDKLNIHLVPHSHDDVGWLKTVDQYFYGNKYKYQKGVRGVQYIIDSVVQALQENADRRFIQVETAFFNQWWKLQNSETQNVVKELVNSGQLDIVGGGWSMNDEANTNYQAIIDQFTLGLNTINELVGDCGKPKIGWQIDPFGHTKEMATIFAKLGYDGLFFTRLDYRESAERQRNKTTEFIWRGNSDLGTDSDIFTSLIYRFYNAPDYFCWDVQCGDTPMIDDKKSPEYNIEKRVNEFAKYAEEQAKYYKTKNVLITMGGDFTYQAAEMYYMNMDKLIQGFSEFRNDINIIYSTPSCYLKAVNDEAIAKKLTFSLKTDDFMPYANDKHSYWTGFYTSRPNSKRFERQGNNLLQVTKQLATFGKLKGKDINDDLSSLKEVMGIMQHHDAITGTEKQHVADDYVKMLATSTSKAETHVDELIAELLRKEEDATAPMIKMHSCLLANVSRCQPSTAERFIVAVYNPLSHPVSHYVRLPVTSVEYTVTGMQGSTVTHQVVPSIDKFENMQAETPSLYELVFHAKSIPALGVKYFYVVKQDKDVNKPDLIKPDPDKFSLGTSKTGIEIDDETGLLKSVTLNGQTVNIKQEFLFYYSANGTNETPEKRASGAYVFRPNSTYKDAIPITEKSIVNVYSGKMFDEVHQQFSSWVKQIIRVYKIENHIEFDWVVGPIDYIDYQGVEVISRFTSELNTKGTFYTDSNGRGLIKRVRNHRETYQYTNEEPISGNYYPITNRIIIKDEEQDLEFAILNDRAQGGSSLKDGEIELMIHRRLMNDDNFGVDEALNETEFGKGVVVRGQHHLIFGTNTAAQQHNLVQKNQLAPWIFIGDASSEENSLENLLEKSRFKFSGLTRSLPNNAHILTLEPWGTDSLLLRLEHIFEGQEDSELSQPVTVDLKDLFTLFKIMSIRETTLGANQALSDNSKLQWITEGQDGRMLHKPTFLADEDLQINLNSMEIRTFIIEIELDDKTGEEVCESDECEESCYDCTDGNDGGANIISPHIFVLFTLLVACLI